MNKRSTFWYWVIAIVITLLAAYYQRTTGPTYPKKVPVSVNGKTYKLKLVRSLGLDEKPEVKLAISDTTVKATLFYKRYLSNDSLSSVVFRYEERPIHSFVMNKVFKMNSEKGYFVVVPPQPAAGKLQYYFTISGKNSTTTYFQDDPVVIRFKGAVPGYILAPHILAMFIAMLLSTLAGALAIGKHPSFRFYSFLTLGLFIVGGLILGPFVQKFAFGDFWTGIPFGWDLTDNKTLIALIGWAVAVWYNRKTEKPLLVVLASVLLLLVYSIPHSMFGSHLNYESGKVVTGFIHFFL